MAKVLNISKHFSVICISFFENTLLALYPTILILLWCCWSGNSKRLPKQHRLLLLLLIFPQKSKVNPCYRGHNSLWIKNLEESSWIWPKSLFPEDVLPTSAKVGMKSTVLPSYDSHEPQQWSGRQDIPKAQEWHFYRGGNQQLLNWT